MADPDRPQKKEPYAIEVEKGRPYLWCRYGGSANQPFSDSSHYGMDFTPAMYKAAKSEIKHFHRCEQSGNGPLCDGTHRTL